MTAAIPSSHETPTTLKMQRSSSEPDYVSKETLLTKETYQQEISLLVRNIEQDEVLLNEKPTLISYYCAQVTFSLDNPLGSEGCISTELLSQFGTKLLEFEEVREFLQDALETEYSHLWIKVLYYLGSTLLERFNDPSEQFDAVFYQALCQLEHPTDEIQRLSHDQLIDFFYLICAHPVFNGVIYETIFEDVKFLKHLYSLGLKYAQRHLSLSTYTIAFQHEPISKKDTYILLRDAAEKDHLLQQNPAEEIYHFVIKKSGLCPPWLSPNTLATRSSCLEMCGMYSKVSEKEFFFKHNERFLVSILPFLQSLFCSSLSIEFSPILISTLKKQYSEVLRTIANGGAQQMIARLKQPVLSTQSDLSHDTSHFSRVLRLIFLMDKYLGSRDNSSFSQFLDQIESQITCLKHEASNIESTLDQQEHIFDIVIMLDGFNPFITQFPAYLKIVKILNEHFQKNPLSSHTEASQCIQRYLTRGFYHREVEELATIIYRTWWFSNHQLTTTVDKTWWFFNQQADQYFQTDQKFSLLTRLHAWEIRDRLISEQKIVSFPSSDSFVTDFERYFRQKYPLLPFDQPFVYNEFWNLCSFSQNPEAKVKYYI